MIKAVIDISVFVAGFLTKNKVSSPAQIISIWRAGGFTLVMSPQIWQELVAKLIEKEIDQEIIVDLIKVIGKIGLHIKGAYEVTRLDPVDPDDNKFLAATLESQADYLVSLDKKHTLPLKHYKGTQIITPDLFIRALMTEQAD